MADSTGSLLSSVSTTTNSIESIIDSQRYAGDDTTGKYSDNIVLLDEAMSNAIDGSTRLIGAPHQFLKHNDPRFGSSKLGRMYGEKLLMEAPLVYIKPGVSEFLPNASSSERKGWAAAIANINNDGGLGLKKLLSDSEDDDPIQYFGIKSDYSGYMSKVNMLCRMLAVFLGIQKLKVPWDKSTTFASYDWRGYRLKSQYGNVRQNSSSTNLTKMLKDFGKIVSTAITTDYEYIQFYVQPNASYSESYSNSTTTSVIESFTEQLQGVAKELQVVSSMSLDISGSMESLSSQIDEATKSVFTGDGAISSLFKRITGTAKNVISGGNFILPEIWNTSSMDTSYSFELHLVTPYGNKLAWYINVGVPMMFAVGLMLPIQQTANVVSSPYLIQAFSPGWWNCQMGIFDSMSIEKGGDGTWNKAGLPNEVTIRFSLKDLYSSISIPTNATQFMANTGMLNFLMTNAGVDISNQTLGDKFNIWKGIINNSFNSVFDDQAYSKMMAFKHGALNIFKTLK